VCVAADGVKVAGTDAGSAEIFELEFGERGEDAVARAAASADVVLVVAGNDPHINGRETEDRTTLRLPAHQERLLRAARAANPDTVLALVSSYPYAVDHAGLSAVLWTAHGGQAAGTALARVLAGDVSPAGRLPQTWYAGDDDLPGLLDYDVIGGRQTYLYFEGTPLFPFGHGLSYARFAYADLRIHRDADADALTVSCTVTNTSGTTADEVTQLYIRAVAPSVPRPRRELAAHRRIRLAPDASTTVTFELQLSAFEFWDVAHGRRRLEPGPYELLVGASSEDIRLRATVELDGEPGSPRPLRELGLRAADFDEQRDTVIVDRTREAGDAVTPVDDRTGELLYRECDFADGVTRITVEAAGEGVVELSLGDGPSASWPPPTGSPAVEGPASGSPAIELTLDGTRGPYDYRTLTAAFTADGVRDVRLRLRGRVRLAHVGFSG
jgi:beta-glucosidase